MADNSKNPLTGLDTWSVPISQATNRDPLAAKGLLQMASRYLAEGQPLPPEIAAWIARGLNMISEGADAKLAFKLAQRRGRPPEHSEEFERFVAEHIHLSGLGLHKGINAAGSGMGAYLDAAIQFEVSENTAESYYKKHRDSILMKEKIRKDFAQESQAE